MLYCGFGEQARHEHMSDEYKDRYIIRTLLKTPPRYYSQYREHLEFHIPNWTRVVRSNITKDLPNIQYLQLEESSRTRFQLCTVFVYVWSSFKAEYGSTR